MDRGLQNLGSWANDHASTETERELVTEQALELPSAPNSNDRAMAPVQADQSTQPCSQPAVSINVSSSSIFTPSASSESYAMQKWFLQPLHDQPWSVVSQRAGTDVGKEMATSEAADCKDAEAAQK